MAGGVAAALASWRLACANMADHVSPGISVSVANVE
jgi:hypothetical protein